MDSVSQRNGAVPALGQQPGEIAFGSAPFMVIWEVTRACDLACAHCRASAMPLRHPGELTTEEGHALLDEIRRFGHPLFIFTGGDPLRRPDIFDLIGHARSIGLRVGLSPSGTPLLTPENIGRAASAGLHAISISIDGPTAGVHDGFRGVPGSFEWCLRGARAADREGLALQINSTITRHNLEHLEAMAELVGTLGARRWSVFFLVPVGRGEGLERMSAQEHEMALATLYDLSNRYPFRIKTTEAQHYRRVAMERLSAEKGLPLEALAQATRSGFGRFLPGINSGKGFLFISHTGEIYPSGFLPLACGNVRNESLVEVYQEHPVFRALRDPERLKGRCGQCAFRSLCGGSRARAYALTGDYLAEDPACSHVPEVQTAW